MEGWEVKPRWEKKKKSNHKVGSEQAVITSRTCNVDLLWLALSLSTLIELKVLQNFS